MKTIVESRDIDVDDVPWLENTRPRNPVTHDFVDRRADALRKTVVVERGRNGPASDRVLVDDGVDLLGGHTGAQALSDEQQSLGRHLTAHPDRIDFAAVLDDDGHDP